MNQPLARNRFLRLVHGPAAGRALPIAAYPGLHLVGGGVADLVGNAGHQAACACALVERYDAPWALTAMDLSVEAEACGATVRVVDGEVPTVVGRRLSDAAAVSALRLPQPGDARTAVPLGAVTRLAKALPDRLVIGGMIGPFTLAGRLWGVAEFLELTASEPELAQDLVERVTGFLIDYALAFRSAGAGALLIAEPTAGLLSPRALARYSAPNVRRIVAAVEDGDFSVILHNCGAKPAHLDAFWSSGASAIHCGAPMDLSAALAAAGPERVVCGNLDPSAIVTGLAPDAVAEHARTLRQHHASAPNFVLSSGCDLPPHTTLAQLDAFMGR
jgi:uroporphyrinogen decarboxylase